MNDRKDSAITEQVDSRLDDLFGNDDGEQHGGSESEFSSDSSSTLLTEEEAPDPHLNDRIDDFFGKDNMPMKKLGDTMGFSASDIEKSAIKDLKSVVLSLEWEITDQVMQKLGEEIRKLEEKEKNNKFAVAFLQLLGSLGKYIRKKRAEAHPDSITLLNSVYENLEKVMLSQDLSDSDKKKMLVAQVSQYKKLKDEIVVFKTTGLPRQEETEDVTEETTPPRSEGSAVSESYRTEEASQVGGRPSQTDGIGDLAPTPVTPEKWLHEILNSMESIRKTIQIEMGLLRSDLKKQRKD